MLLQKKGQHCFGIKLKININTVKVTKPFSAVEKLSSLTIQHNKELCFTLKEMVDFDVDLLTKGAVDNKTLSEAINFLLPYLIVTKIINVDVSDQCMENNVLHELIVNLFQHISTSATLEYRTHPRL